MGFHKGIGTNFGGTSKRNTLYLCLQDTEFAGWSRTGLAGWGKNATDGPLSKELMKIDTPIVVDDYCERKV